MLKLFWLTHKDSIKFFLKFVLILVITLVTLDILNKLNIRIPLFRSNKTASIVISVIKLAIAPFIIFVSYEIVLEIIFYIRSVRQISKLLNTNTCETDCSLYINELVTAFNLHRDTCRKSSKSLKIAFKNKIMQYSKDELHIALCELDVECSKRFCEYFDITIN